MTREQAAHAITIHEAALIEAEAVLNGGYAIVQSAARVSYYIRSGAASPEWQALYTVYAKECGRPYEQLFSSAVRPQTEASVARIVKQREASTARLRKALTRFAN